MSRSFASRRDESWSSCARSGTTCPRSSGIVRVACLCLFLWSQRSVSLWRPKQVRRPSVLHDCFVGSRDGEHSHAMADQVCYVYAVVPPATAVSVAPAGIDDLPVELIAERDVAALVSRVDATTYGAGIDDQIADVSWLAPRATAHDAVMTWASDVGPVVPLPLLSL